MHEIINIMKAHAERLDGQNAALRYGVVTSIDAARHRVKVMLMPDGNTTSWLPMMVQAAGAGWGLAALPEAGMQVAVMGTHGSNSDLLVMGTVHSDVDKPPMVANAIGGDCSRRARRIDAGPQNGRGAAVVRGWHDLFAWQRRHRRRSAR